METTNLGQSLFDIAVVWKERLEDLAKGFAPRHLQDAITTVVEESEEGNIIIRIKADRSIAPDARAQEYGSGLHAQKGSPSYVQINPRNHTYLAFPWETANASPERFRFTYPDHRVMLQHVNHPGIVGANGGQGYIRPAISVLRQMAKSELSVNLKRAILADIRTSFARK
jgi:hypothetical protein